jgi:hypothetical protein
MRANESAADRIVRVVLGLALAALIPLKIVTGAAAIAVGVVAGIALVTGLVGFCAIYALFGLATNKGKS